MFDSIKIYSGIISSIVEVFATHPIDNYKTQYQYSISKNIKPNIHIHSLYKGVICKDSFDHSRNM